MIGSSITRRYAEALISIGVEENCCDLLEAELTRVNDTLKESKELRSIIFSSTYTAEQRKEILKEVIRRLEVSKNMVNFMSLLIDKKRIDILPHIRDRYEELYDVIVGRIRAKVIVSGSMPENSFVQLKETFERITGKKVILETEEDPSILGGIITKLGNVIYDGSIRTQLEKVKRAMIRGEEV